MLKHHQSSFREAAQTRHALETATQVILLVRNQRMFPLQQGMF